MSDDQRRPPQPRDDPPPGAVPPDGPASDDLGRTGAGSHSSERDPAGDADRAGEDIQDPDPYPGPAAAPSSDRGDAATRVAPEGPGPVPVNPSAPPPPSTSARDPNVEAISRAGLAPDTDDWLREVAAQVDPRLDRVAAGWRGSEQSGAARACVFGLMLGRLGNDYPHTTEDLSRVAEAHPSFGTLPAGNRLATLREIAADRQRGATWIAPLVGVDDPSRLQDILD